MFLEDKANGETPSLDGFISFLGGQPGDGKYEWTNSGNCACAQYLKSIGHYREYWLSAHEDVMGKLNRIAAGSMDTNKFEGGYRETDWTFGNCLDRAKKVKEAA